MKVSNIIIPIVFLFSTFAISQTSGVIVYKETLNLGIPVEREWSLFFNDKNSIYVETKNSLDDNKEDSKIIGSEDLVINLNVKKFFAASIADKTIKSQGTVATDFYIIKENLPKIKWELINEKKTISSFECQKAKGYFRGRAYFAWFTNDIPSWSGPWKLFGLPGAILEFKDETGQIKSSAVKVEINDTIDINKILNSHKGKGKLLTIEDYVELKQKENELTLKYAMAKLGREADIRNIEPSKRQGFELKYEWEEALEKKKN